MPTECTSDLFGFSSVEGRKVVAGFDGGAMSSEAGALLLGATDRAIGLVERFAGCFTDGRRLSLRKSAIVLKSGIRRPLSHITSTLRWVSRSRRRLD